jgi:Recombination endonuclease VII
MDIIVPQKCCYMCKETKPLSEFHNNRSRSDGKAAECRACASNAEWSKNRKRYITKYMIMLGISGEDYNKLLEKQDHKCAICGKPETSHNQHGLKKLAVDHDHVTGKFRGLLCQSCNVKLGVLEDIEFVHAAQQYLERHATS